jgi:FdrA protein
VTDTASTDPPAAPIAALLRSQVRVVNIGLPGFAEELRRAGVTVVQLDWAPPAVANPRLRALLAKLSSE